MEGQRFDNLTRNVVTGRSRRIVLKGALSGVTGGLIGKGITTIAAQGSCVERAKKCAADSDCCSGICEFDARGRGRCGSCPDQDCPDGNYFDPHDCQCYCSYDRQTCTGDNVCINRTGCGCPEGTFACGAERCIPVTAGACCTSDDCGANETCCNETCVDLSSDLANCGVCGLSCAESTDQCLVAACAIGACTFIPVAGEIACSTGNACKTGELSQGGICGGGDDVVCDSNNPCIIDSCDPTSGCVQTMKIEGSSCDDGNPCNGNEVCDGAGHCTEGTPVVCHPSDQCHGVGVCDTETGICSDPPLDGIPCDDQNQNSCTINDTCQQGVCRGTPADFDTDPNNCGGCGQSCPAWTGNSAATCGGYGSCCVTTSAGPICCPYGYTRPSTYSYTCNYHDCNCYQHAYSCGAFDSDTCYETICSTCWDICSYPICSFY